MECFKLTNITLNGVKDVEYGEIKFPYFHVQDNFEEDDYPSIVGIYGFNGSGKTAVIDSIQLLNTFVWNVNNAPNIFFKDFVCKWKDSSTINYSFLLIKNDLNVKIDYSISFKDSTNENERCFDLLSESLSYSIFVCSTNTYSNKVTPIKIDFTNNDSETILSDKTYMKLKNVFDDNCVFQNAVNLQTLKNESFKNATSMILSNRFIEIIASSNNPKLKQASLILSNFYNFLKNKLFVYSTKMDAMSNLGSSALIGISRSTNNNENNYGILAMPLNGSFEIDDNDYSNYLDFVNQINVLLKAFIPSFDSKLLMLDTYLNSNTNGKNQTMKRVQYVRIINEKMVPFSNESNGIKKLVNIASALILAYNDPNVILAIDELDSGVFEYLLGQILDVLGSGLKGQLIFTAHNITALSVLDKTQLYFTTTNPKNRYIRLRSMQSENNPENFYLRALKVGGQKEKLMDEIHRGEISRALRAGFKNNKQ